MGEPGYCMIFMIPQLLCVFVLRNAPIASFWLEIFERVKVPSVINPCSQGWGDTQWFCIVYDFLEKIQIFLKLIIVYMIYTFSQATIENYAMYLSIYVADCVHLYGQKNLYKWNNLSIQL